MLLSTSDTHLRPKFALLLKFSNQTSFLCSLRVRLLFFDKAENYNFYPCHQWELSRSKLTRHMSFIDFCISVDFSLSCSVDYC